MFASIQSSWVLNYANFLFYFIYLFFQIYFIYVYTSFSIFLQHTVPAPGCIQYDAPLGVLQEVYCVILSNEVVYCFTAVQ